MAHQPVEDLRAVQQRLRDLLKRTEEAMVLEHTAPEQFVQLQAEIMEELQRLAAKQPAAQAPPKRAG